MEFPKVHNNIVGPGGAYVKPGNISHAHTAHSNREKARFIAINYVIERNARTAPSTWLSTSAVCSSLC